MGLQLDESDSSLLLYIRITFASFNLVGYIQCSIDLWTRADRGWLIICFAGL